MGVLSKRERVVRGLRGLERSEVGEGETEWEWERGGVKVGEWSVTPSCGGGVGGDCVVVVEREGREVQRQKGVSSISPKKTSFEKMPEWLSFWEGGG